MNLQLTKIQRHNAFDYNLLSEFMVKKNGKLVINAGSGYIKKEDDNNNDKEKINLMQKFERKFQMQSILKSYNEALRIHQKTYGNNLTSLNNKNKINKLSLPHLNKMKENPNFRIQNYNYRSRRNLRNKNFLAKRKYLSHDQNNFKEILDDVKLDNSIDYNDYFYHTSNNFPQGTTSDINEKDLNTNTANKTTPYNNMHNQNKNRKLLKTMSQDCIYLFGKNKIVLNHKNIKNKYTENSNQNSDNNKTPFIYYELDFDPHRTNTRLKNRFEFFKSDTFQDFTIIKQEYINKIRRMLEGKNSFKYHPRFLPSHNRVKTIIRKKEYLK